MKARVLTKILNDTKYTVNNQEDCIAIGSPLCSDLISVDKNTLKIKLALDTWHEGRESLERNEELLFIYDKLTEMIESGEIIEIINGKDELENPLPVFTVDNGVLIETFTDKYGWPNTTIDGDIMYENTYFKTKQKAILHGISELGYSIENVKERIENLELDLEKAKNRLSEKEQQLLTLKTLL